MKTRRLSKPMISAFLAGITWMTGCNFYYEKPDSLSLDPGKVVGSNGDYPTWDLVNRRIFAPRCISCHRELRSLRAVRARLDEIQKRVVLERSMPPSKPLSENDLSLLEKWINLGAPEFAPPPPTGGTPSPAPSPAPSSSPEPEPQPSLEPLLPTFASIHDQILVPRCLRCHSPEGSAKKIPLSTAKDLLDSPQDLVIPGNPEESGLILAITRTDRKKMPPPESGPPLRPEEIEAIRTWIKKGAKD